MDICIEFSKMDGATHHALENEVVLLKNSLSFKRPKYVNTEKYHNCCVILNIISALRESLNQPFAQHLTIWKSVGNPEDV